MNNNAIATAQIKPELITGEHGLLIKPRALTTYDLVRKMDAKKVLVATNRPAMPTHTDMESISR